MTISFLRNSNLPTSRNTETVQRKVHYDVLRYLDMHEVVLLVMIDMSENFDTVHHLILLTLLEYEFIIQGLI